jgi:hypothetical protein
MGHPGGLTSKNYKNGLMMFAHHLVGHVNASWLESHVLSAKDFNVLRRAVLSEM